MTSTDALPTAQAREIVPATTPGGRREPGRATTGRVERIDRFELRRRLA